MAASSSAAAAAAEPRLPKHDAFISFRGEDVRKSFIGHLYSALSGKQIKAYLDEVSLQKGDTISPALRKAIEESEISIIVFSRNYASSSWCLDELVHILKCKKENARVLPIFLGIDPSHIREPKGSYAKAFVRHEKRFEMEKVLEWRQALKDAAGISGWDSRNMSESKIVEEVVERVKKELDKINPKRSDVFKGLVGIPQRLEKFKSFLDSPTVRVVGIWGMGGIGKTTLARIVFNQFHNDFEGSYFAPNVRENVLNKGLDTFRKEVYSELLGGKTLDTFRSSAVDRRLSRTKALLVLDDVESPMQFEALVGDRDRFCPGSKIIVTSRNKVKVDEEYKVEELDSNDACKLFYLNAFGHESCRRGFELVSDLVVEYTKGHPLALKVLGASVFYFLKSIKEWEKELEKLKRIPNDEIQVVLKRSYNALDAEEKGLYLDIACFFKGKRRDFVEGILEDKPISGLVNKSLISIEDGRICMHDLIEDMGRNIVLQSTEKLGERSRLWIAKDVSFVLENNIGTEAIEGISLPRIDSFVRLRPDVFKKMSKLRLLKIEGDGKRGREFIWEGLKYLPNGLRYLHWQDYPGKSLPSNFKPQYLVELHMPYSSLEQLWDGVQEFGSLKRINLRKSVCLTKIPDLSQAPKLKSINLSGCYDLIHIPSLPKLESINLFGCSSLSHIPSLKLQDTLDASAYRLWLRVEQPNFEALDTPPNRLWLRAQHPYFEALNAPGCIILDGCVKLTTLTKLSGNIIVLVLSRNALKELPSSIESLESLLHLDLVSCKNLKSLPKLPRNIEILDFDDSGIEQIPSSSIECLRSLQILSLCCCSKLESLPMLSGLCSLTKLYLSFSNIREIPASIGMLYKLKVLKILRCENLQSLPELPLFIESVEADDCSSLEMVSTLRSILILGRWLDKYDSDGRNYRIEFSFSNCKKLGEDAINNIFREFLYKVFCTATTPPEEVDSARAIGQVLVCHPTTEFLGWWKFRNEYEGSSKPISHIPRWFNNQSEGRSITIPLPTNWYNPKTFLGFVVSAIVKSDNDRYESAYDPPTFGFECIVHLLTAGDRFRVDADYRYYNGNVLSGDHIVMLYNNFHHSKVDFEKDYIKASFEFVGLENGFVKRCGVRMLYLRDAIEKLDVNHSDSDNFESWRIV